MCNHFGPHSNSGKLYQNHEMLYIVGFRAPGKADQLRTLGRHCPQLLLLWGFLSKTPLFFWLVGHTPVRLGLFGRNSGKIPERPRKRSQSVSCNFPREYGWDAPNPTIQGIWGSQSVSRILSPPVRLGTPLFQKWFRRGPLRAGHGIPSSTGGISELEST